MEENWWLAYLNDLDSEGKRLEALTNLNTMINKHGNNLPRPVIERLLQSSVLYECAADEKQPLAELTVELLGYCLEQLDMNTADEHLPQLLRLGLTHSNPAVRSLVLNSLLKGLRRQTMACEVHPLPSTELLLYVLDELKQTETQCSATAISILTLIMSQRLNDADIQAKLVELLQQNEIIRCRAYELGVMLAKRSAASLNSVEFILDAALSELDNDDVLLQASVMEILVPLAEQNHGLSYMERRRVFDVISNRVQRIEENPLDMLLIPSIMKFFGKIAAVQPQKIIAGYPQMITCLFDLLHSGGEAVLPTAIDTLANLAGSVPGKVLLNLHFQPAMEQLMKKYSNYSKSASSSIKIRVLNSLDVMYLLEAPPTAELSVILKHWYECFADGQQVNQIMELINTPFSDLQLAALAWLKTLCQFRWGITNLKRTGGAIEFLLSRQHDLHKDVKFLKWQIMEILAVSSEFTPTETVKFAAYVNEGPFYIQSEVNIATEPQGNA